MFSEGGHPDAEPVGNSMVDEQPANAAEVPHPSAEGATNSSVRQRVGETFQCDVCEYNTNNKRNLKTHMRIHTGDMLQCDVCEFKTTRSDYLTAHMRKHTGDML